jgi:type I restriction enzyme S subunit
MAGDFLETTVGDVCKVFDGPHATPTRLDSGPVFLGITSLNKGRIDLSTSDHLSEEDFIKWTRRVTPQEGDVVFSYETRLGEAAIIPEGLRCCLGRRMGLMRPDPEKLDSRFLLYYYLGPEFQNVIRERTIHGSTVERIALIEFPKFPIRIPPLPSQRAIASVLGTLDDLIELNRETNEILEEMARTLFKSWFVDFDPVRAKLEGRPPAGMDAATAALFPDHFQDSELGQIPKGWEVKPLGDLADMDKGLSYKGSGLEEEGGMPMVNLGCFSGRGIFNTDKIKRYTGDYRERHLVHEGDLVIANTDMTQNRVIIGSPSIVPKLGRESKFIFTHHVFAVRFKPGADIFRRYVYFTLLKPEFREIAEGFSTGTTVLALPRDGLTKYMLCLPPVPLIEEFERQAEPLLAIIHANNEESRELATLRDTLLPKLLSGEVEAPKYTPDHDA